MANAGSVVIRIDGDDSGFKKEVQKVEREARSAAASLGKAFQKAGMTQSQAMTKAWAEVNRACENGTAVVIDGVETIVYKNKKLKESINDVSGNGYEKLAQSSESAARRTSHNMDAIRRSASAMATGVKASVKVAGVAIKGFMVVGSAVSAAWTAVGVTSVKYNAEIEQLETSFKVMTGSAEKAANVMERLRKLGAKTPFATKDLAQATQLLMQYGFNADDAIDRMEMLGDIAQGSAEKMNRIATAYGQMNSAGKVQLEDVKQMIEAGFNPLLEISEKTGESMESLYDRISKGTLSVQEITDAMRSATSEGGRFFGSMEEQSKTVQGLLSTLQDELQTLGGDMFKPISESMRTQLLPEAIRLVQEMQKAYARNGWDGLIDSLTAQIPKLLNSATGAIEKLSVKLKAKLPGITKKLIAALPQILEVAADSILPNLVDIVFGVISTATEEITARLPELVPVIARGIGNLIKGVVTGLASTTYGFFEGIETALQKLGVLSMTPLEAFEQAWEKTDTSQIKELDVSVDVNITAEDYQAKIDAAVADVREALANIPGLSEGQKADIESAIIDGTGIQLLTDTLNDMSLPEGKAEEITAAITSAVDTIDSVLSDPEFGLDQAAIDNINAVIADGGSVQEALEAYDIDPAKAQEAAEKIETAMAGIETAAAGLGFEPGTIEGMKKSAALDKAAIETSLLLMGVDPSVIDPVLASYDTIAGSLTAGIDGIYKYIADMFTDGKPESDEQVQAAKDAITNAANEAQTQLDQWYRDALADIETQGLTPEEAAARTEEVTKIYNDLTSDIESTTGTLLSQTEGMVGKSRDYCLQATAEMQNTFALLKDIATQIDMLTDEETNILKTRRNLVKSGAVTDTASQLQAFQVTSAEFESAIDAAQTRKQEALDKAVEELGTDTEAYAQREREITEQLARDEAAAWAKYNSENAQIIGGIVKASPELSKAFEDFNAEQYTAEMVQKFQEALNEAQTEGLDFTTFMEKVTADGSGFDMAAIEAALLEHLSFGSLEEAISNALTAPEGTSLLETNINDYVNGVSTDLSAAMSNAGIDESTIPAIKAAVEKGYLTAAGEVDWTSFETILSSMAGTSIANATTAIENSQGTLTTAAETATSGVPGAMDKSSETYQSGVEVARGFARGIESKRQLAIAAAKSMALGAVSTINRTLQIKSPSRLTTQSGSYFGQGFALGIRDEIGNARSAAQQMANGALNALDSIGGRISLSQQVNAGSMANAFQGMLAAMNLATNNGQPVQLFINGRMVAETMRNDTRAAQSAFNTQLALGVGKR